MANTSMAVDDTGGKKSGGPKAAKTAKQSRPGFFGRIQIFMAEVKAELEKVSWPSKEELKSLTGVVLLTLAILGAIIALYDTVFLKVVQLLLLLG